MLKHLRLWLPASALLALVSAGCMLISGQFVVTYGFADHGLDPLTVASPTTLAGVPVDLNTIGTYKDHKSDLKDVVDLALVGKLTNTAGSTSDIEVWMVANPTTVYTTDAAVRGAGQRVWGPITLAAGASRQIGWNDSAKLFVGRKALVGEIKGDGRFDLYALASGGYAFRLDKGALIAVIAAGK
jgi:hypothetical protein